MAEGLLRPLGEFLDVEVRVKVSPNEEKVDPGAEPDEGVRDADHHHLLLLSVVGAVGAKRHRRRTGSWGQRQPQLGASVRVAALQEKQAGEAES